jgi:hypothetical protein
MALAIVVRLHARYGSVEEDVVAAAIAQEVSPPAEGTR